MKFNERLYALRRQKGFSQEELGFELGVSRQTVSKWESGQSYPDFQRLVMLADYFEITLDEMMRGLDVQDVRELSESDKKISSLYTPMSKEVRRSCAMPFAGCSSREASSWSFTR